MSKRDSVIDFDDILVELGELGRYQIFTYILICLPVLFAGASSLSYVFTAGVPNYRWVELFLLIWYLSGAPQGFELSPQLFQININILSEDSDIR